MHAEVVIIGGGPSGLSAALYLARAGFAPVVFAGDPPGGQLMLTSEVENFPGHKSIHGQELVANIREQAVGFGAKVIDANVEEIIAGEKKDHKILTSYSGYTSVDAKAVLVATGAKALWLGLDSEKRLRGRGVSACATCDGFFFKGKQVAVIGGGDSALEEALFLTKFASHVTIVHRRDTFRASRIMQNRVKAHQKISIEWNAATKDILGSERVDGVLLSYPDGTEKRIDVNGVFVAIGHKPDTDFVKDPILKDKKGYIITKQHIAEKLIFDKEEMLGYGIDLDKLVSQEYYPSSSNVEGIFAAGDCVDYRYRQASTAAGFGVAASLDIEKYIESL